MLRKTRTIAAFVALAFVLYAWNPAALRAQAPGMAPEVREALLKLQPESGRKYRVDIITMTPVDEIYGIWGHTSLRIHNAELGADYIFDWGVFQFDETFLIRFLKGDPAYMLAARPLASTLNFYRHIERTVFTQQLIMSDDQARRLFQLVAHNAHPDNRTYIYHHYKNNCVTKIRDIADGLSGGKLKETMGPRPAGKTYRDTSNEYARNVWHWIGINLIQGTVTDVPVSAYEEMYLPISFMDLLEEYRAERLAAGEESIIGPKTLVMSGAPLAEPSGWVSVPVALALLIALLFVLPAARPTQAILARIGRIARNVWHYGAGFVGIVLSIFWIFTGHDSMINNVNVLAFAPVLFFVPLIARFLKDKRETMEKVYLALAALPLLGLLLVLTTLWPQPALPFLLPAAAIQISIWFGFKRGI